MVESPQEALLNHHLSAERRVARRRLFTPEQAAAVVAVGSSPQGSGSQFRMMGIGCFLSAGILGHVHSLTFRTFQGLDIV